MKTLNYLFFLFIFFLNACDSSSTPVDDAGVDGDSDIDISDINHDTSDASDVTEDIVIPLEDCLTDGTDLPVVDNCQHAVSYGQSAYAVYYPYIFIVIRENKEGYFWAFYKISVVDGSSTKIGEMEKKLPKTTMAVVPEQDSVYFVANTSYSGGAEENQLPYLYKVNYETNEMVELTDSYPELRSPICKQYNGKTSIHYFNPEHNTLLIQCEYKLSSTAIGMVDLYLLDGDTGEMHFMADGMDTYNMRFPQQPSNINPAYFNFLKSNWEPDWNYGDEHHHEFWRVDGEVPVKEYEITFASGTTSFVGQMSSDNWFYFSQLEEGKEVLKGLNLNGDELTGPSVDYHQHGGIPFSTKYTNLVAWTTSHADNVVNTGNGIIQPQYIEDLQVWDKETGIIRTFAWEHSQSYYGMASIMAGDPEGRFVVYLGFTEGSTIFYKDLYSAGILNESGNLLEGD